MEPLRPRFGQAFEWLVTSAFLAATLAVAALIVWEMSTMRQAPAAPAPTAPAVAPSPVQGVSVPAMLLSGGGQIRVGDPLSSVTALVGEGTEQERTRGRLGARVTRAYEGDGARFLLILEPFELNGEPRVTAIYLR